MPDRTATDNGSTTGDGPQGVVAAVTELAHLRFDRALEELQSVDGRARVAMDVDTGLAIGIDGAFPMPMPAAARNLPGSDRAAAAAVLFLDQFGGLFGIPGWHVLKPLSASPLGRSIWFTFEAQACGEKVNAHVCADEDTVKHVRIEDLPTAV
jgi:hypothetical protein